MNEEPTTQADEDNPIGEMNLPGRIRHGARAMALAGLSVGLGIAGVIGHAADQTTTPTWTV